MKYVMASSTSQLARCVALGFLGLVTSLLLLCTAWLFLDMEQNESIRHEYPPREEPLKCVLPHEEAIVHMAIVYTWVNGSLPCYRQLREQFGGKKAIGGSRDREMGELRYSIRSIRKFLPWHKGPIYIVSPGHFPSWLNTTHPGIHVINQDHLFPAYAQRFLPTFNTNAIEQFLHLIPGLTEMFLHMNDDYIFTSPVSKHDLFNCYGGFKIFQEPKTIPRQSKADGLPHITPEKKKQGIWLASVLHTQASMDKRFGHHSRRFLKHAPYVYTQASLQAIHLIYRTELYETLLHKFRSKDDVIVPLLHHYYLLEVNLSPTSFRKDPDALPVSIAQAEEARQFRLFHLQNGQQSQLQRSFQAIFTGQDVYKCIALNDEYNDRNVARITMGFLHRFLPAPSELEAQLIYTKGASSTTGSTTQQVLPIVYSIRSWPTCEVNDALLPPMPMTYFQSSKVNLYDSTMYLGFTSPSVFKRATTTRGGYEIKNGNEVALSSKANIDIDLSTLESMLQSFLHGICFFLGVFTTLACVNHQSSTQPFIVGRFFKSFRARGREIHPHKLYE